MSRPLPLTTQTLYAELLELLLADSARRAPGAAPGAFTTKIVKGHEYVYLQYFEPGGRSRQAYLGRLTPELERLMARAKDERAEARETRAAREILCSQIAAGGGWSVGAAPARVLKAFADAGVLDAGTVLVGTHSFGLLGNMLGVRWEALHARTEDIDLAAIGLAAAPDSGPIDAPGALKRLEMGFLPVPALHPRSPSTSFKVRGSTLRVDLLTPGSGEKPVFVSRLKTHAEPLAYLDYLLEAPERAAVIDAGGFLVLVPAPARFALHKVLVAERRGAAFQAKAAKDLAQAAELIAYLAKARPGDLRRASDALDARGWRRRFASSWKPFAASHPEAAAAGELLGL